MEVSGGVWSATPQRRGGAREAGRAAGSNLLITWRGELTGDKAAGKLQELTSRCHHCQ